MFDCNRNGDIRIRETFCFRSVLELGKKLRNCAAIAASFLMIMILQNMLFSFYVAFGFEHETFTAAPFPVRGDTQRVKNNRRSKHGQFPFLRFFN